MKKICAFILAVALIALAGCSSTSTSHKASSRDYSADIEAGENIKADIISGLDGEDILLLWNKEESLTVLVISGEADISARVGRAGDIPAFAEAFCDIAIEAVKNADCEIGCVQLRSYDDTIDDGTLVNWNSYDGVTGTFLVESEDLIKSGADIQYMQTYFGNIEALQEASKELQGEWQCQNRDGCRLIVNGLSVNFVSEGEIGSKSYCRVTTYEFGCDDDNTLVICSNSGKVYYTPKSDQEGNLHIVDDTRDDIYIKISDNTEVPAEKVEPEVGMTKDEVKASTWGRPQDVNKTIASTSEREQWVYDDGYIYFQDGIVTSIQEK